MVEVLLMGPAGQAAGTTRVQVEPATVAVIVELLGQRYGSAFRTIAEGSRVWIDGRTAAPSDAVPDGSELSILPPVSGG